MKTCSACGMTKEFKAFSKSRGKKDGLQSRCKACDKLLRRTPEQKAAHRVRRENEELLYSRGLKRCNKCGKIKPLVEFHANKGSRHGILAKCKACAKQYQQENRERIKAYGVQYRIEHAVEIAERAARRYHSSEKGIAAKKRREDRELLFIQGLKRCSKCGKVKALGMFDNSGSLRYGKDSKCKACNKRYKEERKGKRGKRERGWELRLKF